MTMRNLMLLLKLQINAQYGISTAFRQWKTEKRIPWKGLGLAAIMILSFGILLAMYSFLMWGLYKGALTIHAPQMIITLGAVTGGTIILFFGLFYLISALFLAKDSEFLTSLPVRQESVFASKFLLVLLAEYPFALAFMLPPILIYGAGDSKGLLYYLVSLFCIVLLPLFPLVISAFLALLLMNVVAHSRHRDLITLVGSSLLLVLFMGGQFYLTSRMPEDEQQFILTLMQTGNGIVEFMGRVFPPAVWLTKALASTGPEALINFLYLVAVSVVSSAIVYFLAAFIYQKGAVATMEAEQKQSRKKLTYQSASPILILFKIEWRLLIRTPIYAMNSLIMIFIAPMLLLLPMMGGNFASDPELKIIFDAIRDGKSAAFVMLVLTAFITLITLINPAISSTFSREGNCFWMLKNIPVPPATQVYGKFWAGYSISFLGSLFAVIVSAFSFQIPLDMCFLILLLCAFALIPVNVAGILIDLLRPKLVWNNAQEAIKQNANVLFAMLAGFFILFLYGILGYFVLSFMTSLYGVFAIMASALILFSALSFSLLNRISRNAYQKIEC